MSQYIDTQASVQTTASLFPSFSGLYQKIPEKETLNETEDKTAEIFGEFYTKLCERTEKESSDQSNFNCASDAITFTGCLTGIPLGISTLLCFIPAQIGWPLTGGCCLVGTVGGVGLMLNKEDSVLTKKTTHILDICKELASFSDAFNMFKQDPKEENVQPLFAQFGKVITAVQLRKPFNGSNKESHYERHPVKNCIYFDHRDMDLFSDSGKLYLMDAVVKIIKEKDEDAHIVSEWNEMLNSGIVDGYKEPWKRLHIANPSHEHYVQFNKNLRQLNSTDFVNTIIKTLREILEKDLLSR